MKQFNTLFNTPLLIRPELIEDINALLFSGDLSKMVLSQFEKREREDAEFIQRVVGNTGIVEINGVISPSGTWLSLFFGYCPTNLIRAAIKNFLDDPAISRIWLRVNSPGGHVDGVPETSNFIFESRSKKKIIASVSSMACSAGYWLGSSAEEFYLESEIYEAGSIGVYVLHYDMSKALEKEGVKVTEITSGKYKTLGSPYKPLDEEAKAIIGERIFFLHDLFVQAVARNRGISEAEAKALADGLVYYGQKAIKLKLVDGIMSKEAIETQNDLKIKAQSKEDEKVETEDVDEEEEEEEQAEAEDMDEEEEEKALQKIYPAVCKRLQKKGFRAGVKKERARIQSIEEITNEGFEKEAAEYKFKNGKSADMFASYQLKEMKNRGGITPEALRETRNQQVPFAHAKPEKVNAEVEQFQNEVIAQAGILGKQIASEAKGEKFQLN